MPGLSLSRHQKLNTNEESKTIFKGVGRVCVSQNIIKARSYFKKKGSVHQFGVLWFIIDEALMSNTNNELNAAI